jgi:hypothetical protein
MCIKTIMSKSPMSERGLYDRQKKKLEADIKDTEEHLAKLLALAEQ